MKALVILIVVAVVALVAFNYFTTGELKLLPGGSSGPEEDMVNQLRGDFRNAAREYRQAGRGAAVSGVDTSTAAEAALAKVDRIEKELEGIVKNTESDEERRDAESLLEEIAEYKRKVG